MHFHQAVLENNLEQITLAYESGWNKLTEKYYSKTEWPEAEIIAPLVNDGKFGIQHHSSVGSELNALSQMVFS